MPMRAALSAFLALCAVGCASAPARVAIGPDEASERTPRRGREGTPTPPARAETRRRQDGGVMRLGGGLGGGVARAAVLGPRATADAGAAGAASFTWSYTALDLASVGGGIVGLGAAGHGALGAEVRAAVFPFGRAPGPLADGELFVHGGLLARLGADPPGSRQGTALVGVGLGWEGLRRGALAAGPYVEALFARGDEAAAMAIVGLAGSYSTAYRPERDPSR
jgi:hypothetical protein